MASEKVRKSGREKCKSVTDIVRAVSEIIAEDTKRYPKEKGAEYFFRGEDRLYGKDQKSGVLSKGFDSCVDRKKEWYMNEREFYQEALRHNVVSFASDKTMVERVARMQHYQLPTRFADITSNAFVATLFACTEGYGSPNDKGEVSDGYIRVIKVLPEKMKSFTSDIITAIAHLPLVKPTDIDVDHAHGVDYLRYEITNERPGFSMDIECSSKKRTVLEKLLRKELKHVWAFKPILNTDRVFSQEGAFLAFGCGSKKRPLHPIFSRANATKKNCPSYGIIQIDEICIDGSAKSLIRDELRHFGMPEERLYPDLSEVCKVIKTRAVNPKTGVRM